MFDSPLTTEDAATVQAALDAIAMRISKWPPGLRRAYEKACAVLRKHHEPA